MEKLSEEEIQKRLSTLHNYEVEYPKLKKKYLHMKQRVKELEEELARERMERKESVEALKLQIEELREMVFGRKRGGGDENGQGGQSPSEPELLKDKKLRSSASYRRMTPKDEDVTQETMHSIDCCPDCGNLLKNLHEVVRYLEDIIIPALSGMKIVQKQRIETGFCTHCRKWKSSIPIQKQVCSLGENVRMRIVYCITVLGQPFEKIARDLEDTFGISVSDGEMVHIQTMEAVKLLPEYHAIDVRIREDPCRHGDETSWPVQEEGEGQWAWVKTASKTFDTIFRLGRTRGKGNAMELFDGNQPTVTDDYAAYDNVEHHGLCWAHPKRKFQDLAESSILPKERRQHCKEFYERFCLLLADVQAIVASPYDCDQRKEAADRLRPVIVTLTNPSPYDPKKLATLKSTFLKNTEKYLFCVLETNITITNNKFGTVLPMTAAARTTFTCSGGKRASREATSVATHPCAPRPSNE